MSNYSCDIIQDLLALYHDEVCSEESRRVVEEHLAECESCSTVAKLLDNTELEDSISEQAQDVLKSHKRKQRRKIITVIVGALVILLAVVFFWVIKPRIELNSLVSEFLPEVGEGAGYFTEYDVTDDSLVTLNTDVLSIGIPADYVQKDIGELDAVMYHDSENDDLSVLVMTSADDYSDMSLFHRDNYDDVSDEEYEVIVKHLREWFGALGNGLPDSAYGTYKCMHMLSDGDRSFWNIGQNIAFGIMGIMKEELPIFGDTVYIYETDEKCGIVTISLPDDENDTYYAMVDMYSAADLNTPHSLIIRSESLDEVYAIINSIKIK